MRILMLSRVPWRNDTSFGNTYSNLLTGIEDVRIAYIQCCEGYPNDAIVSDCFRISERDLLGSIFKHTECGHRIMIRNKETRPISKSAFPLFFKKHPLQIFYWIRDLLWFFGKWRSQALRDFIDDFQPDILFAPYYASIYMNDVKKYVYEHASVPMVSYVSDDIYTLRQFSLSPLFWLNRLLIRRKVRMTACLNEFLYVISKQQQKEYAMLLHSDCRLLYKGVQYLLPKAAHSCSHPLKMLYTGNLGSGRWKTLAKIGKALRQINENKTHITLQVYSMTPLTAHIRRALTIPGSLNFCGAATALEVKQLHAESDILIHCESFQLRDRLQVRLSFSTKIVDYFASRKCIFAVGPSSVASIQYLREQDAAIIANTEKEVASVLKTLLEKPRLIGQYADKAWNCGERNHNLSIIQEGLIKDFQRCINQRELRRENSPD